MNSGHPRDLSGILAEILGEKRRELEAARRAEGEASLRARAERAPPPRDFAAALARGGAGAPRAIAEIKRASPSAGPIRPGADPAAIAAEYEAAGAAAVSVLTDRSFFDGDLAHLAAVRARVALPVLRKDFAIDPYHLLEARAAGADAVLLIVAALDDRVLRSLLAQATALGMTALVEVHDVAEADRAVDAGARVIGVNHRDLATLTIDMTLFEKIAPRLPPTAITVAESGIRAAADVRRLAGAGADAILVGEHLMRQPSPGAALRELFG